MPATASAPDVRARLLWARGCRSLGGQRGASSGLLLSCVSRRGVAASLRAGLYVPRRSLHHPAPLPPLSGRQRRQRNVPRGPVSPPTVPAAQLLRPVAQHGGG